MAMNARFHFRPSVDRVESFSFFYFSSVRHFSLLIVSIRETKVIFSLRPLKVLFFTFVRYSPPVNRTNFWGRVKKVIFSLFVRYKGYFFPFRPLYSSPVNRTNSWGRVGVCAEPINIFVILFFS